MTCSIGCDARAGDFLGFALSVAQVPPLSNMFSQLLILLKRLIIISWISLFSSSKVCLEMIVETEREQTSS